MKRAIVLSSVTLAACVATEVGNPGLEVNVPETVVRPPDMIANPFDAVFELPPSALGADVREIWVWNLLRGGPAERGAVGADGSIEVFVSGAYSADETTTWFALEVRSEQGFDRLLLVSLEEGRGLVSEPSCFGAPPAVSSGQVVLMSECDEMLVVDLSLMGLGAVEPARVELGPDRRPTVTVTVSGDDVLAARAGSGAFVGVLRIAP